MSQQGDITATLTLNRQQFSAELKAALDEAKAAAGILTNIFKALTPTTDTRALAQVNAIQQKTLNDKKKADAQSAAIRKDAAAKEAKLAAETAAIVARGAAQEKKVIAETSALRKAAASKAAQDAERTAAIAVEAAGKAVLAEQRAEEVKERNRRAEESHIQRLDERRAKAARAEEIRLQKLADAANQAAQVAERNANRSALRAVNMERVSTTRQVTIDPANYNRSREALIDLEASTQEYYETLDKGTDRAAEWRAALDRIRVAIVQLDTASNRRDRQGNQAISATAIADLYEYEIALKRGKITAADFIVELRALSRELETNRLGVEKGTSAYNSFTNAIRRIDGRRAAEELRQVNGGMQGLATSADRLQQILFLVGSGAGLQGLTRFLNTSAKAAFSNQIALQVLNRELTEAGESIPEANAAFEQLGKRFNVNAEDIAAAATPLLRYGFTLEDLIPTLEGVAASSISVGKSATEGINTFSAAVVSQNSNLLNSVGILQNFDVAFQRQAKTLGINKELLDGNAKGAAIMNLVTSETAQELKAADQAMQGYGGSISRAQAAQTRFIREVGEAVLPAMTLFYETATLILSAFNALPGPIKTLLVVTTALATAVTLLGIAYVTVRAVLDDTRIIAPIILRLINNETIARTALGRALIAQARAQGELNKAELRQALNPRRAGEISNLKGLYILLAGAIGKVAAALRTLLFNPVTLGIVAIGLAIRSVIKYFEVFSPIAERFGITFGGITKFVTRTTKAVTDFLDKLPDFGQMLEIFSAALAGVVAQSLNAVTTAFLNIAASATLAGKIIRNPGRIGEAWEEYEARLAEIAENSRQASQEIDFLTGNAMASGGGFKAGVEQVKSLGDALKNLSKGDRETVQGLKNELGDLKLDLDVGDFQNQLDTAIEGIDDLIAKFEASRAAAKGNSGLQQAIKLLIQQAQVQRQSIINSVGEKLITDAENKLADAQISAMKDGDEKVRRQFQRRRVVLAAEFQQYIAGWTGSQDVLRQLISLHNQALGQLQLEEAQQLEDAARQRLDTAQGLTDSLENLRSQLATARADNSGDQLQVLANTYQQELRQLQVAERDQIRAVEDAVASKALTEEAGAAQIQDIRETYAALAIETERRLTDDTVAEIERRQAEVIAAESRTAAIRAQVRASGARANGNESGAIEVEYQEQLRVIAENLNAQLAQENLTADQITAYKEEALARQLQAQQEFSQQSRALSEQDAQAQLDATTRMRQIQVESDAARLRDGGDEQGALKLELDEELQQIAENAQKQLAVAGLTAQEIVRIKNEETALRIQAEEDYQRALGQIGEEELAQRRAISAQTRGIYLDTAVNQLEREGKNRQALKAQLGGEIQLIRDALAEQLRDKSLSDAERVLLTQQAAAKEFAARQDYTNKLADLNKQEADQLREATEARISAQNANIQGGIPRLQAEFEQAQRLRRRERQEQLEDAGGNYSLRRRLVVQFQGEERQLTRTHQMRLVKMAKDATKAYADAYENYLEQVEALQEEAEQQQLANQVSTQAAAQERAQLELQRIQRLNDESVVPNVNAEALAFSRVNTELQRGVELASANVAMLRRQGAAAGEVISALGRQAQAQRAVVDAIQSQIDRTKELQDKAKAAANAVSGALAYEEAGRKATDPYGYGRNGPTMGELQDQLGNLKGILALQQQVGASYQDQQGTLEAIAQIQQELIKRGLIDPKLGSGVGYDKGALEKSVADAQRAAAEAEQAKVQAAALDQLLADALTKLNEFLDAQAEAEVGVEVDPKKKEQLEKDLEAQKEALVETFGSAAAEQIISGFAEGLTFGDILASLSKDMADDFVPQAQSVGEAAGGAMMTGMAAGVEAHQGALLSAVRAAFEAVDELLPHSDARKGPLSRLSHSGKAIPRTLALNMLNELPTLTEATKRLAAAASPALSVPTSMMTPAGAGNTSYGDTIIQVGDSLLPSSTMLEAEARRLGRTAMREGMLVARRMGRR